MVCSGVVTGHSMELAKSYYLLKPNCIRADQGVTSGRSATHLGRALPPATAPQLASSTLRSAECCNKNK